MYYSHPLGLVAIIAVCTSIDIAILDVVETSEEDNFFI